MFTYIRLKNFKSFGDIFFDFRLKKNPKSYQDVKRMIVVYGENGSGKSNLTEAMAFLSRAIVNFAAKERIMNDENEKMKSRLSHAFENFLNMYRMTQCDQPTEVEYGLLIDGKEWKYRLVFTDRLLEESLYGMQEKIRGEIFYIAYQKNGDIQTSFWKKLFLNSKFKEDMVDEVEKFWGNYSFLSLFLYQRINVNDSYLWKSVNSKLFQFVDYALNMCINTRKNEGDRFIGRKNNDFLEELESGEVEAKEENQIRATETMLKTFFTQTYADIKDVYYETKPIEAQMLHYDLYLKKKIAGSVKTIPFVWESYGTRSVLKKLPYLFAGFQGMTVVCDELDNGIHDLLIKSVILSAKDEMELLAERDGENFTGQIIITTHNTLVLEELDASDVYVINSDYLGNKEAVCLDEFSIQDTNNKRLKYVKGLFGGVPMVDDIDFDSMMPQEDASEEDTEDDA